ncbi:MAG: hypothetical protein GXP55_23765 [Deltaproteobacteria bacterium]|nr:hypothetical protein [Deltaproteobacteria bacterium]
MYQSTTKILSILSLVWLAACGARTGFGEPDLSAPSDSSVADDAVVPRDSGPMDSGVDAPVDAPPDAPAPVDAGPRPCRVAAPVDLLLVIDDSGSMWEEQQNLAANLPRLVGDLLDPPDANGDGRPDFRAARDIHMGVVTTSIDGVAACGSVAEDGVLRTMPGPGLGGCADSYPSFLTFRPGDDPLAATDDFTCLARVGTDGCGLEQPLEAALKALLPSDSSLPMIGRRPHGDLENAGFLRDDSLLAVVIVTDEDDCSTEDPTLFDGPSPDPRELPPCSRPDDPLYPLSRYVEAFRSLRPTRPDLFAFAVVAGMPEGLVADPTAIDYDRVLDHPRMVVRIDPIRGFGLVEACRGRGGSAFPARRLVRLAQEFGDQATLGSICAESFSPLVASIAHLVGTRACTEFGD